MKTQSKNKINLKELAETITPKQFDKLRTLMHKKGLDDTKDRVALLNKEKEFKQLEKLWYDPNNKAFKITTICYLDCGFWANSKGKITKSSVDGSVYVDERLHKKIIRNVIAKDITKIEKILKSLIKKGHKKALEDMGFIG